MKKRYFLFLLLILLTVCSKAVIGHRTQVLYVYNWADYIAEDLIAAFEEETGIRVSYRTFFTNEEMYARVKSGSPAYDVLIPSDYMIEKMIREDLLQPLDFSKIPGYIYISPIFLGSVYDAENSYSVPYFWGTLGILYNTELVEEEVESWDILWNEQYSKKILMIDSQRDSMAVALKRLGFSINSFKEEELELAKKELLKQKPLVLAYSLHDIKEKMLSGEAALAVCWSGDAMDVILSGENFDYAVPEEGSNFWVDAMVIPASAGNPEAAHKFIDFMCRPENAARNSEYVGYSTPNEAALEFLPAERINSCVTYPEQEVIDNCEVFRDPGEHISLYNRMWSEVLNK